MVALSDNSPTLKSASLAPIKQQFSVPFEYNVHFTEGLFDLDNPLLADIVSANGEPGRVLVVVDSGLMEYGPLSGQIMAYVQQYTNQITLVASPLTVLAGEAAKNDPTLVEKLCWVINARGLCRHSYIVAIGGGAVLDMVGYAAAIAHRGIRLIRVPTTVLAQNDSGVGVKNGINAFGKKNFIGTFAPPYAVINDCTFLKTLSDRDWRSGIVEAVKVALIKDPAFFEQIEQSAEALSNRDMAAMQQLIHRCAQLHVEHIGTYGDPFEMGSSRPLDFGHWAAHRLEQMTNYRLRHGEAVAIGIALDTLYSQLSGLIGEQDAQRVLTTLQKLGFNLFVPELFHYLDQPEHPQSIFRGLRDFREHLGGQLTVMLLWAIGQGVEVHEVDIKHYREAIALLTAQAQRLCPTTNQQTNKPNNADSHPNDQTKNLENDFPSNLTGPSNSADSFTRPKIPALAPSNATQLTAELTNSLTNSLAVCVTPIDPQALLPTKAN
jgi:3-dehydroquinate synthase